MKFLEWITTSNRLQHFLVGLGIGVVTGHVDAAILAGAAAEYKDWSYAAKPGGVLGWIDHESFDWIDMGLTSLGGAIGSGIHYGMLYLMR